MRLIDKLRGGDAEERSPEVRALHAAMMAAADGSAAGQRAAFKALAKSKLWVVMPGQTSVDQISANARLSGHATIEARVGLRDGERYLPASTTCERLARSGFPPPGDTLLQLPFASLAAMTRDSGLDSLVVNPGTVPMAHFAGPALAAFADGLVPDGADPRRRAVIDHHALGELEPITEADLPEEFLDLLRRVLAEEAPQLEAVSVGWRQAGQVRPLVIMLASHVELDWPVVMEAIVRRLQDSLPPSLYFGFEPVACTDPRLTDPKRAVVVVRAAIQAEP